MEIHLLNVGRRFNREWIFKNITCTFEKNKSYAILGINGSGKSTLLQIISGALAPSTGSIKYEESLNNNIDIDVIHQKIALAAPYLELIEDFSLSEMLAFHYKFKSRKLKISDHDIIDLLGMQSSKHKLLKHFSSGMKQRVKLALAFCSDTEVLLLDEPTSNLDAQGFIWYMDLIKNFLSDRITIIASNQENEYAFTSNQIHITNYK